MGLAAMSIEKCQRHKKGGDFLVMTLCSSYHSILQIDLLSQSSLREHSAVCPCLTDISI